MLRIAVITGILFLLSHAQLLAADDATPGMSVYPKGKVFPFMGYSGKPARDAVHGFSVAGPDYGAQFSRDPDERAERLEWLRSAGLPMPAFIGVDMHFNDKEKYVERSEQEIRAEIQRQVGELVDDPLVCWWYLSPEEIRYWRKNEIDYLRIASETIRAADPKQRPIWLYEPNHRTAESLAETGQYLDIIGKGSYVNLAGYDRDRIWVRWSVEQEMGAIELLRKVDQRERFALVMPELCKDPEDPADDHLIPDWVRHDVYLGLISGAKGVAIWSLFRRAEVRRTWSIWYNGYAAVADELCGDADLGQVFLFGKPVSEGKIKVTQSRGPETVTLFVGDRTKLELGTITDEERAGAEFDYAPLSSRVLEHDGASYVFVCNSHAQEAVEATLTFAVDETVVSLPDETPLIAKTEGVVQVRLAPFEVKIFRLQAPQLQNKTK